MTDLEKKEQLTITVASIASLKVKLPTDFKDKFIEGLRSGKFSQTTGRLYFPGTDSYCCLGIAAHVCGVNLRENDNWAKGTIPSGDFYPEFNSVPKVFRDDQTLQAHLYNLNDSCGLTFSEIADIIEEYL